MPTPQRLPIVNSDDGTWGDIIRQYLKKEHYDDGTDNAVNGGHQKITVRAGTATAGTAPLKFTSGTLLTSAEAGAVEFNTDSLYFTITTGTVRKKVAIYDDSSGATGDTYYRDASGNFVRLGIGSSGQVLKVTSGLPAWQNAMNLATTTKTTSYTVTSSDAAIFADASSGNVTITLPAASGLNGYSFYIKRLDNVTANTVTIARSGSDTIDGVTSLTIGAQNDVRCVLSDGTKWYVLSSVISDIINSAELRLSSTGSALLASTTHAFQIGADGGANLIADNGKIQSRNNGSASILRLNTSGGSVQIGSASSDTHIYNTLQVDNNVTISGAAPLNFASNTLLSTPQTGAVEFNTDSLYFTITTGTKRKKVAIYDDSSGATGDLYYRDASGNFVRLAAGTNGQTLKVASGLPAWGNGMSFATNTQSTSYTVTSTDAVVFADATTATVTITLPAASGLAGYRFYIKRIDNSASHTVTVSRSGSDTIDGMTTFNLDLQYTAFGVVSNGSAWYIL